MNDIQKKNVCDILDSSGFDLRSALDVRFIDLKLGEPAPEDYQLLDRTIATIQEGIWTSYDPEFDYAKLKTDIYEALLNGRRAETEKPEDYVGESDAVERDRAVIDFTIDWLRCILVSRQLSSVG
ncbi:MAG: hypothetical protein ABR985_18265 [Methanotrichaceae archaeon]|jgi:hypothetical protein